MSGPPALCVMFARLGAFGEPFDLVVSGINPGANVGRAVYHSGTVGAALTARNGNISGVAISQAVTGFGVEGQGWDEMLIGQKWETAVRGRGRVRRCPRRRHADRHRSSSTSTCRTSSSTRSRAGATRASVTSPGGKMATATLVPVEGHEDRSASTMAVG